MGSPEEQSSTSRAAVAQEAGRTMLAHSIALPGGRTATAVLAPADVSGEEAFAALALPRPRGLIVLNGGTSELPADLHAPLRLRLGEVARVAVEERLTVVTGGTDAGIFSLFGQALGDERTAPCVGVAPAGRVTWPGREASTAFTVGDDELVPLEPHHSHFLLVAGEEWGIETEALLSLSDALSVNCASLAVLGGGGSGARREILGHVRAGRAVMVLAGTGRFADALAGAIAGERAPDPETAEIASSGLVVVGPTESPTLADLVRARLGITEGTELR